MAATRAYVIGAAYHKLPVNIVGRSVCTKQALGVDIDNFKTQSGRGKRN